MLSLQTKFLPFVAAFLGVFSTAVFAQTATPTPPDEKPEVVYTEEVKVNISAFDGNGNFADALRKEDVVISEDGRLHQPNIIRHIPANVLILLDTGGANQQGKDFKKTRQTAAALIGRLQENDKVAVMQYYDKVDLLTDWTGDKRAAIESLKKMNFGLRSRFVNALTEATAFLEKLPVENRHLVLIADGLDSVNDREQKISAMKNLTAMNVNVHVLSYTGLEQAVVAQRKSSLGKARPAPALPPGAGNPNDPNANRAVPLFSVNLDREMARSIKERGESLAASEKDLMKLSEDTNGVFYLPATTDEMVEKTADLAKNIDSQYVVTYTPKLPFSESPNGEVRNVEVTSKRTGVYIQAKRKLIVVNGK